MSTINQYQLATIAASLHGTPIERATVAFEIWEACGKVIARQEQNKELIEQSIAVQEELASMFEGQELFTVEEFLRRVMPSSKAPDRMAKLRKWTTKNIAVHEGLSGAALEAEVDRAMRRNRENGLSRSICHPMAEGLRRFLAVDGAELRTKRAEKGAAAKKALGAKKTVPKSRKQSATGRK